MKRHHFDNKGKLPERANNRKAAKRRVSKQRRTAGY
jgi:hypothetical protein